MASSSGSSRSSRTPRTAPDSAGPTCAGSRTAHAPAAASSFAGLTGESPRSHSGLRPGISNSQGQNRAPAPLVTHFSCCEGQKWASAPLEKVRQPVAVFSINRVKYSLPCRHPGNELRRGEDGFDMGEPEKSFSGANYVSRNTFILLLSIFLPQISQLRIFSQLLRRRGGQGTATHLPDFLRDSEIW